MNSSGDCDYHILGKFLPRKEMLRMRDEEIVRTVSTRWSLERHTGCVNTVSWNAPGTMLVSGSDDRTVVLWDATSQFSPIISLPTGHHGNVFCATFVSGTGDAELVTSAADGCVHLMNTETGARSEMYASWSGIMCHKHVMDPISVSSGLVTVSNGCIVRFDTRDSSSHVAYDLKKDQRLDYLANGLCMIPAPSVIAFNKSNPCMLAVGTMQSFVFLFDVRKMSVPMSRILPINVPTRGTYASGLDWDRCNRLVVNMFGGDVIELDTNFISGSDELSLVRVDRMYFGRQNTETMLQEVGFFGSNDQYIVSGSDCGHLHIWERRGDAAPLVVAPTDKREGVNCVSVHPCGFPVIATSGIASTVDIWCPDFASAEWNWVPIYSESCDEECAENQADLLTARLAECEGRRYYRKQFLARRAVKIRPGNVSARILLVQALRGMHDYEGAFAENYELLAIHPKNLKAHRYSMFSVQVEGHELVELPAPHVVYVLRVSLRGSGVSWQVYRRFSRFLDLERDLAREFNIFRSGLLADPGISLQKSLLARWLSSGRDPEIIRVRRSKIEGFFNFLFSLNDSVAASDILAEFLRIPVNEEPDSFESSHVPDISGMTTPAPVADSAVRFGDWIEETIEKDAMCVLEEMKRSEVQWTEDLVHQVAPLILKEIGKFVHENNQEEGIHPTVTSVCFLCLLADLVSLEKHPEGAGFTQGLRTIEESVWQGSLNLHVRFPTVSNNRLKTFRICRAVGISPHVMLSEDHVAVSQYLGWFTREKTFAALTGPPAATHVYHSELPPIGPASPMAASPWSVHPVSVAGRTQLITGAASDTRDWLMMSLANHAGPFKLTGSVSAGSSWTSVSVPTESLKQIIGKIKLFWRTSGADTEVRLEWQFPLSVDMETVVNLLWNPVEQVSREIMPSAQKNFQDLFCVIDSAKTYFGLNVHPQHIHVTDSSSASPAGSVSVSSGPLVQTTHFVFPDARRPEGIATCSAVKTLGKSMKDSAVIMALVSDPVTEKINQVDPCVRVIRSLHTVGCEIDVHAGTLTGLALLSAETVFLVAGDLLGERLLLWKAFEQFSEMVMAVKGNNGVGKSTTASSWLAANFFPRYMFLRRCGGLLNDSQSSKKIQGFLNRALGHAPVEILESSKRMHPKANITGKYSLRYFERNDSMEDRSQQVKLSKKKKINSANAKSPSTSTLNLLPNVYPARAVSRGHVLTEEDEDLLKNTSIDWSSVPNQWKSPKIT